MSGGPKDKKLKDDLILHLAAGKSKQEFADKNHVSISTVYRWCEDPAVKKALADHNAERIRMMLNRMASRGPWVVDVLTALANNGTDNVKLGACREMLSQMVSLSNWYDIDKRLSEVEGALEKQKQKGKR